MEATSWPTQLETEAAPLAEGHHRGAHHGRPPARVSLMDERVLASSETQLRAEPLIAAGARSRVPTLATRFIRVEYVVMG